MVTTVTTRDIARAAALWRASSDPARAQLAAELHRRGGQDALEALAAALSTPCRRLTWCDLWRFAGIENRRRARNRSRRGRRPRW